jgi:hypothetical protein
MMNRLLYYSHVDYSLRGKFLLNDKQIPCHHLCYRLRTSCINSYPPSAVLIVVETLIRSRPTMPNRIMLTTDPAATIDTN